MYRILARSYDRLVGAVIARLVGRPRTGVPSPTRVPASPEAIEWAGPVVPRVRRVREGLWEFDAPSPVQGTPWPPSRTLHGQLLGSPSARLAVIVLHGACDNEYTFCQWMSGPFCKQGFRAVLPAGPCHLERRMPEWFSGAPFFWTAELVVAGFAQWLVEIRSLLDWLRGEGVERVGLMGYSIGSLIAGLAATLWDDVDFAVLLGPVSHHLHAIRQSHVVRGIWPWMNSLSWQQSVLMDRWAPLYRRPVVPNLLFLMARHDDFQPLPLQHAWWEAWGRPAFHEYDHGHMTLLFCRALYRDLEAFARSRALAPA